jgi:TrmH family RNA methyltransferase
VAAGFQRGSEDLRPVSWYKELNLSRNRREHGFFLVEGRRAIGQIVAVAPHHIEEVLATEKTLRETGGFSCPVRTLPERQLHGVCASKTPQGIAAVVRIPEGSYESGLPRRPGRRILLLDGVQDPGNVGTLIRAAAAFDYSGVVLSGECADPFSPKAVQATAGAVLSVWIRRTSEYLDCVKELKKNGYMLIAADLGGDPPTKDSPAEKSVLALGSEGSGLSVDLLSIADKKIRIPMNSSKVESLNVGVSGAILMD